MGKKMDPRPWVVASILVFVLFSALRWPYLEMPLDRDEGTYLVIGKHITSGALPYSDVYEMKPPGLFYTYGILSSLGAYGFEGARFYTLFIYGGIGLLLFFILYRKGWQWGALMAEISFFALSMNPFVHGYALLPEPLMLFCFLGGVLLLSHAGNRTIPLLFAGFLLGWSVWIKQNMVFPLLFLAFWVGYRQLKRPLPVKALGLTLWGLVFGPALTTFWIMVRGGGSDMYYWMWTYPASVYTQRVSWSKGMTYLQQFLEVSLPISGMWVILAIIGFGLHFFLKRTAWGRATPLLFALFSFLSVCPGLRFYGHYWILILPALALGVGALSEFIFGQLARRTSAIYPQLMMLAFATSALGYHLYDQKEVFLDPAVEVWSRRSYGNNPFLEIQDIASQINSFGTPGAKVAVMGSEPQLYVYLQQRPFTAHTFITFLNKRHPRRGEMRSEFTSDVQREKPKYVLFVNHPYSWSIAEGDHRDVHTWAYRYTKNHYRPIGLYEMDGTGKDRKIWAQHPNQLRPRAAKYIQVSIRK